MASVDDDISKIEQEIKRHEQIIVDLKIQRNARLPIFKLPVEILCRIFQFTQDTWTGPYAHFHQSGSLEWITVTRVCQHWRNAALNEPSLWTRPPLYNAKWTSVMLQRSQMAGITLAFDDRSRVRADLITTVVSHIAHTTSLTVQRTEKQVVQKLLTNLRSTVAPMLETLKIDGTSTSPYHLVAIIDESDRIPARLPENAFLGTTKLRRLSLMGIDIDWKSHLLSSLTELTLEKISPGARPSRAEFLSMLERNPGLRKLTLRDAFPTSVHLTNPSVDDRPRISLSSLESLSITAEAVECEFFCHNIVISDKLKAINGLVKYDDNNNGQFSKFLSALDEANPLEHLGSSSRRASIVGVIPHRSMPSMPILSFTTSGRVSGSVTFSSDIVGYCEPDDSALDLQLDLQSPSFYPMPAPAGVDSGAIGNRIFSDFFHGLHWDNLAQLIISSLRVYGSEFSATLAKTFGTLPQLRAVIVGASCANHLINALLLDSDKDPALCPDSVTFPGLFHIGLREVTFDHEFDDNTLKMDRLLDCLMDRCERGIELHSISVEDCRLFTDMDAELLEEIVVNVLWDGEESGYSDEEEEEEEDPEFYEDDESYYDEDGLYGLWSGPFY